MSYASCRSESEKGSNNNHHWEDNDSDEADNDYFDEECLLRSLLHAPNVTKPSDRNSCISTIFPDWNPNISVVATRCSQDKCHIYTIDQSHRARKKFLLDFSSSNHAIEAILLLQSSKPSPNPSSSSTNNNRISAINKKKSDNFSIKDAKRNDGTIMLVVLTRDGTLWKSKLELFSWSLLLEDILNCNKIHYYRHDEIMIPCQLSSLDHHDPTLSSASLLWGMDTLISTNTTSSHHQDDNLNMTTIIVSGKNILSGPLFIIIPLSSRKCVCAVQEILFENNNDYDNYQITSILSFSNSHHHIIPPINTTYENMNKRQNYDQVVMIGMDNGSVWSCFWSTYNHHQFDTENFTTNDKHYGKKIDFIHAKRIFEVTPHQPIQSILLLPSNLTIHYDENTSDKRQRTNHKLAIICAQGNIYLYQNIQNNGLWLFSQIYPSLKIGTITSASAIKLQMADISNINPPSSKGKHKLMDKYAVLLTNQMGNAYLMSINQLCNIHVNKDHRIISKSPLKVLPHSNLLILSNLGSNLSHITSSYDHHPCHCYHDEHNDNTRNIIILSTYTKSLLILEINDDYFGITRKRTDYNHQNQPLRKTNENDHDNIKNNNNKHSLLPCSIQEQDNIILEQLSWLQSNGDSLKSPHSYSATDELINPNHNMNRTPAVKNNYKFDKTISMRMKEIRNITSRSSFSSPVSIVIRNNDQHPTHSLKLEKIISAKNRQNDELSFPPNDSINQWSQTVHFIHSATASATGTNHSSESSFSSHNRSNVNVSLFPIYNETQCSSVNYHHHYSSSDKKQQRKFDAIDNNLIPAFYAGSVISTSVPLEKSGNENNATIPLWNRYPSTAFVSESIPYHVDETPTPNISFANGNEKITSDIATDKYNTLYYNNTKKRKIKNYDGEPPIITLPNKKNRQFHVQHNGMNHHRGFISLTQNSKKNSNIGVAFDLLDGICSQNLFHNTILGNQQKSLVEENSDITASKILFSQKMKNKISFSDANNKKNSAIVQLPIDKESYIIKEHKSYRSPCFQSDEQEDSASLKLFRIRHLKLNSFESSIIPSILISKYSSSVTTVTDKKSNNKKDWLLCGSWGGIDSSCVFVDSSRNDEINESCHNFKPQKILDLAIMCQNNFNENEVSSILLLLRSSIMNRLADLYQSPKRYNVSETDSNDEFSPLILTEMMATQAVEKYHSCLGIRKLKKVAMYLSSIIDKQEFDSTNDAAFFFKLYSQIRSFQLPLG